MTQSTVRADILGKLLLIQETLDILTDSPRIAAFLRRALSEIPGVIDVHFYMDREVIPPSKEIEKECTKSEAEWNTTSTCIDCMMWHYIYDLHSDANCAPYVWNADTFD